MFCPRRSEVPSKSFPHDSGEGLGANRSFNYTYKNYGTISRTKLLLHLGLHTVVFTHGGLAFTVHYELAGVKAGLKAGCHKIVICP